MTNQKRNGPHPKPALERFLRKVEKTPECWLWLGTKNNKGYGMFMLESPNKMLAHRAAWILLRGAIPLGACMLHSCDNPGCVNPGHLRVGTHAENMRDAVAKGRHRYIAHYGQDNGQTKLRAEDTLAITAALTAGNQATHAEIAKVFGVTRARVSQIALATRSALTSVSSVPTDVVEEILAMREAGFTQKEITESFEGLPEQVVHEVLFGNKPVPQAKLDAERVRSMRQLAEDGFSQRELAKHFGVVQGRVSQILRRNAWAHVV